VADGFFNRLFDPERMRPFARLALLGLALLQGVVGSLAYMMGTGVTSRSSVGQVLSGWHRGTCRKSCQ
jgi:hypothetical protein